MRNREKYTTEDIFETCVTHLYLSKDSTARYIEYPQYEEDANDIFAGGAQYSASIVTYSPSRNEVYTKNDDTENNIP